MTEKPLVSVIINCYNGEKYLREAIDSVISQTYTNWEIIFWDNQSTDSTAEIVKSYNNPKIRYIYAPTHTPLGEARNLAMEKASGEFICYLDADDTWVDKCLETYVNYIHKYPQCALFYSKYKAVDGERTWYSNNRKMDRVFTAEEFVKHYDVGISSAIIRKSVIKDNCIRFDKRFSLIEDYDFFIRTSIWAPVLSIPEVLMNYRYHEGNLSKSNKWEQELEILCSLIVAQEDGYENHKNFYRTIYVLKNHYSVYRYIRENRKSAAIFTILKTCIYNFSFIRLIISVIFGEKCAKIFRSIVNN